MIIDFKQKELPAYAANVLWCLCIEQLYVLIRIEVHSEKVIVY